VAHSEGLLPSATGHQTKGEGVAVEQVETDEEFLWHGARRAHGNSREEHVERDHPHGYQLAPRFHHAEKIIQHDWHETETTSPTKPELLILNRRQCRPQSDLSNRGESERVDFQNASSLEMNSPQESMEMTPRDAIEVCIVQATRL
jgi:hypothetical protein